MIQPILFLHLHGCHLLMHELTRLKTMVAEGEQE